MEHERLQSMTAVGDVTEKAGIATGGGASLFSFLSGNDWASILGVVLTLLMFVVNWYYRYRADKRMERLSTQHAAQSAEWHHAAMEAADFEITTAKGYQEQADDEMDSALGFAKTKT